MELKPTKAMVMKYLLNLQPKLDNKVYMKVLKILVSRGFLPILLDQKQLYYKFKYHFNLKEDNIWLLDHFKGFIRWYNKEYGTFHRSSWLNYRKVFEDIYFHTRGNVLITGTSSGIGKATAKLFMSKGFIVYGFDISGLIFDDGKYHHYQVDVTNFEGLPELPVDIDIIINNAGIIEEDKALSTNVMGYVNIVDKYGMNNPELTSIVNVSSVGGHNGMCGLLHSTSQGARLTYTKALALQLGKQSQVLVNSVSPGAVHTNLEPKLYKDKTAYNLVKKENLLNRWIKPEEIAETIYFLAVTNSSITGQDIIIDAGETINSNFITPRKK